MTKKIKIGNFRIIAIALFALFLLIAPCSVRNYFETQLEIENTQTLNRNKTTVAQSNLCGVWENLKQKTTVEKQKKNIENDCIPIATNIVLSVRELDIQNDKVFISLEENQKNPLPFYILYKRLKIMM